MDQNLRDKINEAMESPIVGNYLFGSDEIDQLYALAENAIPRLMAGGSVSYTHLTLPTICSV